MCSLPHGAQLANLCQNVSTAPANPRLALSPPAMPPSPEKDFDGDLQTRAFADPRDDAKASSVFAL